jgi:hypothetical protein
LNCVYFIQKILHEKRREKGGEGRAGRKGKGEGEGNRERETSKGKIPNKAQFKSLIIGSRLLSSKRYAIGLFCGSTYASKEKTS